MANEQNLVPLPKRSKEAQREIRSKGGKAGAEAKRRRKTLKESMNALLDLPISNVRDYNKVARMGINIEDIDNSQLVIVALFNRAKSGDVYAIKELREIVGEDTSMGEPVKIIDDL